MQSKKCIIVASGSSSRGFIPPSDIPIIGVNGTAEWLPKMDYWFTLDPSTVNKRRMRSLHKGTEYYMAIDKDKMEEYERDYPGVHVLERIGVDIKKPPKRNVIEKKIVRGRVINRVHRVVDRNFKQPDDSFAKGLNTTPWVINSGNSAFGALGLAYHLGFTDVLLVGVDGDSKERVEGGYSRDLSHLPQLFESAIDQINIYNAGNLSSSKIPHKTIEQFRRIE